MLHMFVKSPGLGERGGGGSHFRFTRILGVIKDRSSYLRFKSKNYTS